MIPYLQFELKDSLSTGTPKIITAGKNVKFDNLLSASTYNTTSGALPSISYDESSGIFGIKHAGVYLVNWFVAQQTGLSVDGSNFGIVLNPDATTTSTIVGSGHVKISPSSAFAIITVTDDEASSTTGKQFSLQNVSSHDAALSERTAVKAGLAVFGVATDLFARSYGHWQASGWDKITDPYNLNHTEAIKFNQSLIAPVGISATDSENGAGTKSGSDTFTLIKPGVYQVAWEIPIEASYAVESVEIALELGGTNVYSSAYSPLPIGVISGTAIIKTETFNTDLKLINYQPDDGDIIQIGNFTNLTIHQIS